MSLKDKLALLKARRLEGRELNQTHVVEEDRRTVLLADPKTRNFEQKKERAEKKLADIQARKEAEEKGEDYDRQQYLTYGADEVERRDRKKKKKNTDEGFADYQTAQFRQYSRLTKELKPDAEEYGKSMKVWEEQGMGADSLGYGQHDKVSRAGLERLVADLEKQKEKREKFSRRRTFHQDADVDYINDRNMNFNKKLQRHYGVHTQDVKDSLERGTSV